MPESYSVENKRNLLKSAACLLGLLASFAGAMYGQATVGTILGTATSSDGAPVADVSITVTNEGTHANRNVITGKQGDFVVSDLNPGTYSISGSAAGFAAFQNTGIVLQSQQTIRVDVSLKIGDVATQVAVTAGAPVIDSEMPSISTTVTQVELERSSSNLLGTNGSTGVSGLIYYTSLLPTGHQGNGAQWMMGGSTGGEAYYNVDGISSNSALFANAQGPAFPAYDIIQEVKNDAVNNKAEMGQIYNVTVITRSGTDQFHGSVFEHFGNQDLQAQSYFSTSNPPFTNNDFGGGLGGPILRRRLFFFAAFEGVLDSQPIAINPNVPTPAFRSGDFSSLLSNSTPTVIKNPYTGKPFTNNIITPDLLQSSQSQAAKKWQDQFYPAPNFGPTNQYVGNFRGTYPQTYYTNRYDLRLDANLSSKNTAFVRFSYVRASPEGLTSGFPPFITGYQIQTRKSYSGVLSDTWVLTPNLLNIAKVGAMHAANPRGGILLGQPILDNLGIQGFPIAPPTAAGIPSLSISNFSSPTQVASNNPTEQTIQVTDQLTYQRGGHIIKAGVEYRPQQGNSYFDPKFGTFGFNGAYSGFAYADFLLGLPQSTSYTYTRPAEYARQYFLSGFVQDDWRLRQNLTISYGVRYDFDSAPVDKANIISMFNPTDGAIVVPSVAAAQPYITPGFPSQIPIESAKQAGFPTRSLRNPFRVGLYPRLGFAYQVSPRMVVRGGYGIYNGDLTLDLAAFLYQSPFGGTISYTNQIAAGTPAITFTNPTNTSTGKLGAVVINGIDQNLRNPYAQQWNLTVEQDLGFNTSLRLSYIGSNHSLLYQRNLNQVHASATVPWSQANTAYPLYKTATQISNGGVMRYNAFTAELNRHMKKNLLFEGAVTWAKNLTDDPGTGDIEAGIVAEDTYDLHRQYGNEPYTPRIQFVSNLIYSLPIGPGQLLLARNNLWSKLFGGWQLSAAYLANTGNFLTPTFSGVDPTNINAFAGSASKVPGVSPAPLGPRTVNNWFNPKAYAVPPAGQFGNTGAGTLVGPGSQILNAALFKSFPLWRENTVEVSGSFTNVLNHPNFANPDVTITDTTVGKITGVQSLFFGPRSGLVSVRYTF